MWNSLRNKDAKTVHPEERIFRPEGGVLIVSGWQLALYRWICAIKDGERKIDTNFAAFFSNDDCCDFLNVLALRLEDRLYNDTIARWHLDKLKELYRIFNDPLTASWFKTVAVTIRFLDDLLKKYQISYANQRPIFLLGSYRVMIISLFEPETEIKTVIENFLFKQDEAISRLRGRYVRFTSKQKKALPESKILSSKDETDITDLFADAKELMQGIEKLFREEKSECCKCLSRCCLM